MNRVPSEKDATVMYYLERAINGKFEKRVREKLEPLKEEESVVSSYQNNALCNEAMNGKLRELDFEMLPQPPRF